MITIEDAVSAFVLGLKPSQTEQTVETYSQGVQRFKQFLTTVGRSLTDGSCLFAVGRRRD
jgi:hypothetical protein